MCGDHMFKEVILPAILFSMIICAALYVSQELEGAHHAYQKNINWFFLHIDEERL